MNHFTYEAKQMQTETESRGLNRCIICGFRWKNEAEKEHICTDYMVPADVVYCVLDPAAAIIDTTWIKKSLLELFPNIKV